MKKRIYNGPSVEEVKVEIEKGFAGSLSNNPENFGEMNEAGTFLEGDTYTW